MQLIIYFWLFWRGGGGGEGLGGGGSDSSCITSVDIDSKQFKIKKKNYMSVFEFDGLFFRLRKRTIL